MTCFIDNKIQTTIFNSCAGRNKERNRDIISIFFGFDGHGSNTLQDAGELFGLTRECVRLITNKYKKHLKDNFDFFKNELKVATHIFNENTPCSEKKIKEILLQQKILSKNCKLDGIVNFLNILNTQSHKLFKIIEHNGIRFIVKKEDIHLCKTIESIGCKEISHNGATSLEYIQNMLLNKNKKVKKSFIVEVFNTIPHIIWLNNGWIFLRDKGRNRLISRLEKIFSTIKSATPENLLIAINRSWNKDRKENTKLLPINIFIELINKMDKFYIENNLVFSKNSLTNYELKNYEEKIFSSLKNSKEGFLKEKELEDLLVGNDKEKWHFSMALNYSPLFIKRQNERGMYRLVGNAD